MVYRLRKWAGLGSADGLENRGRLGCNIRSGLVAGLETEVEFVAILDQD